MSSVRPRLFSPSRGGAAFSEPPPISVSPLASSSSRGLNSLSPATLYCPYGQSPYASFHLNVILTRLRQIVEVSSNVIIAICTLFRRLGGGGYLVAPIDRSLTLSFTFEPENEHSFYGRLFPGIELNCYRLIIPSVRVYSKDAADLLDILLPLKGPVVAIDLGYFLASIITQFDIKHMMLPALTELPVLNAKFLHFDITRHEEARTTVVRLLTFDGYVGGGVNAMNMIDVAASAGASTIAANQAFRNILYGMVEVRIQLTEEEQDWINRDTKNAYFTRKLSVSHGHAYLAACREIIRRDFDTTFNLKTTRQRVLMLGASAREYKEYNKNVHVSFQFANVETKDMDRTMYRLSHAADSQF